ncbi:MAG: hypothetical protein LBB74_06530 [Chitinispirillales bacterium]|jgi:hypothetical protein|nr:hypothetical protein [Chitinispirillales bacterium]
MADTVIRLKKQLAESGEALRRLKAQCIAHPKDAVLPVRVRVMEERVESLNAFVRQAGIEAESVSGAIGKRVSEGRAGAKSLRGKRGVKVASGRGVLVNSDYCLDRIIRKNNGILKAYNTMELLRVVKYG